MPCCALAACIVGQLILVVSAVKGALFGRVNAGPMRNQAVEWRLDSAAAASLEVTAASAAWRLGRPSFRGLVLAAALEIVIVLGAIYGVVEHLGHSAGVKHSAHIHPDEDHAHHRGHFHAADD